MTHGNPSGSVVTRHFRFVVPSVTASPSPDRLSRIVASIRSPMKNAINPKTAIKKQIATSVITLVLTPSIWRILALK